jgi:hypothetical protein
LSSEPTEATNVSPISPTITPGTQADAGAGARSIQNDVFNNLVESNDDFLGLLSYSLYKRHKIEWMNAHPGEDFESFKRFACTATQVTMYKNEAEQMFKNIVDLTLEQYGNEMREGIQQSEMVASINRLNPTFSAKLGNHLVGGVCSVLVALTFYGIFALYSAFQGGGGVEGGAKKAIESYMEAGKPAGAPSETPQAPPPSQKLQ